MLSALQHRESDRVPIDLGATDSSGIMGIAYNRLKQRLGVSGTTRVFDMRQMIAKVEPPVVTAVGSDAVPLLIEPRQWKPWTLADGSVVQIPAKALLRRLDDGTMAHFAEDGTVLARSPAGGLYFDTVRHPLEDARTLEDIDAGMPFIESYDWPAHLDDTFPLMAERAKHLFESTSYAIVGNLCVHLFAAGQSLRGFENFMTDLLVDKPLVHRLMERLIEGYLPRIDRYLEAVGKYVQVILVNDDLGTQGGPQVAPELYREMIKPYQKSLWGYIKKASGKPLLLHSCGSVADLIPDLIDAGVDALNPIQISAARMDPRVLKREYGRDITFWGGGCDTQSILSRGTPRQVRDEVRRRVDELAPGGGFVFCQVHNIQADVPPENVLAMYEELGSLA